MLDRDEKLYLNDIIESIIAIELYTHGMKQEQFVNDRKTYSATIREIQIICEAVKHLRKKTIENYPDIIWRDISDLRNILIHEYFGIDFDILWNVIVDDLPLLKKAVKTLLQD